MSWRLASSLATLRKQINDTHPNRNSASDGAIGDEAHQRQGSASDHNPWFKDANGVGVVTAIDITHDHKKGVDIDKFTDMLVENKDSRIKYIIANGLICIPFKQSWASEWGWHWQDYAGDPHTSHAHISVNTHNYDDAKEWNLGGVDMKINTASEEKRLKQVTLHRDNIKDSELGGEVGRSLENSLDRIQDSKEWHTINHVVKVAWPEAVKKMKAYEQQLAAFQDKLKTAGGALTAEEEQKLQDLVNTSKKLVEDTNKLAEQVKE